MNYETRITQEPVNCSDSELCTFLQALAEGFLPTFYSDTSQSAQSKSMSIASKSYQRGKKTVLFHGFQSLMMSRNLTDDHGADSLTLWPVDSRARILASLEKAQESTESKVGYGQKWRASLAKFDPDSRSWKTAQLSLIEDSDESSVTWPRSGMTADGQCWELPTLAQTTSVTGSGLWPTPTCPNGGRSVAHVTNWRSERTAYSAAGKKVQVDLAQAVKRWPTPTVCGNYNRKGASATSGDGLATAVQMWRTPSASVVEPKSTVVKLTGRKPSDPQVGLADQVGGSLNPTWVEWLMGWPLGWTDLKPLETGKSHCAQQQRGACSQVEDDAV